MCTSQSWDTSAWPHHNKYELQARRSFHKHSYERTVRGDEGKHCISRNVGLLQYIHTLPLCWHMTHMILLIMILLWTIRHINLSLSAPRHLSQEKIAPLLLTAKATAVACFNEVTAQLTARKQTNGPILKADRFKHTKWYEMGSKTSRGEKSTYSKCCFISDSSAYLEIELTNKVRFTCIEIKTDGYQQTSDRLVQQLLDKRDILWK